MTRWVVTNLSDMESRSIDRADGVPERSVRSVSGDVTGFPDAAGGDVGRTDDRLELANRAAAGRFESHEQLQGMRSPGLPSEQAVDSLALMSTRYHAEPSLAGCCRPVGSSFEPPTTGFGPRLDGGVLESSAARTSLRAPALESERRSLETRHRSVPAGPGGD